jgi:uncharacterized membrane protein YhaH (DUF805 family)
MDFGTAIKTCFRKYADFTGRALRSEYWWFFLFVYLAQIALRVLWLPLAVVFAIGVLLPHIAVGARRLHDTDRSGWWLLIGLIPVVGWIVLIVFFVQRSQPNNNRFGVVPLSHDALAAET